MTQSSCALLAKGYWFPPTFLTGLRRDGAASSTQAGVTHAHRVASEEIFGPVLSVISKLKVES